MAASQAPHIIQRNCDGAYTVPPCDVMYTDHRTLHITGSIDDEMAASIIDQLIYLASVDPNEPIYVYINSPGGSVDAGLAIYDTMQAIEPDVETIGAGTVASMAAVLLLGGAPGYRRMLPHTRMLLHDPLIAGLGPTSCLDLSARAEDLMKVRNSIIDIISLHSRLERSEVEELTAKDTYLSAEEAVDKGLADRVLDKLFI